MKRLILGGFHSQRMPKGFTIIETMLFLGITGLMVAGVLVSAGGSINTQRYHDSVSSLQAFLQQQYSEVINVANDRDSGWKCNSAGVTEVVSGTTRGQSDCVILGRLITNDGNNKLIVNNIVGFMPFPDTTSGLNDNEIFMTTVETGPPLIKGFGTNISTIGQQVYEVEWGASLADTDGNDINFSVMILRSPVSGLIRTYVDTNEAISSSGGIQTKLIDVLAASNKELKVCVSPTGLFTGKPMAILVVAGAGGPNGVETLGEASSECK